MKCINCGVSNNFVKVCEYCGSSMRLLDSEKSLAQGIAKPNRRVIIHLIHYHCDSMGKEDILGLYEKVKETTMNVYPDSEIYLVNSIDNITTNVLSEDEIIHEQNLTSLIKIEGGISFIVNISGYKKWQKLMEDLSKLQKTTLLTIGYIETEDSGEIANGDSVLHSFEDGKLVDGPLYWYDSLHDYDGSNPFVVEFNGDTDRALEKIHSTYCPSARNENWIFHTISELVLDPEYYGGKKYFLL